MSLERWKLRANALDRASTACLTVGVFAPLAAAIYAVPQQLPSATVYVVGVLSWLCAALALHLWADLAIQVGEKELT